MDAVEGVTPGGNQAVYVSFNPSSRNFGFMMTADQINMGLTIGEDGKPSIFAEGGNIMKPVDTAFTIEPGNWYCVFLAVDQSGNFQGVLWESTAPGGVLNVDNYTILDFAGFSE